MTIDKEGTEVQFALVSRSVDLVLKVFYSENFLHEITAPKQSPITEMGLH